MITDKNRLEKVSEWYKSEGFYARLVSYGYLTLKPYFKGNTILELGCADGLMTKMLVKHFKKAVSVDGSSRYCDEIRGKLKEKNLKVICSLFEDLQLDEKFDTIVIAHILEHVANPVHILKLAKNWLEEDGVVLIDVPNANSLHRQAGVKMGLLKSCTELNDLDIKLGHRRIYTCDTLRKDILCADLKIIKMGGVFLKPLTNSQIENWWTEEMMDAFYELGKSYPEIAGEIYAVCEK